MFGWCNWAAARASFSNRAICFWSSTAAKGKTLRATRRSREIWLRFVDDSHSTASDLAEENEVAQALFGGYQGGLRHGFAPFVARHLARCAIEELETAKRGFQGLFEIGMSGHDRVDIGGEFELSGGQVLIENVRQPLLLLGRELVDR